MSSVLPSLNLTKFPTNDVSDSARNHRWVILIDGTWCDHKPNKNTMVGILSELMETSNFQVVRYYAGIGTYSSYSDRFVGGLTGWGIRRRLFKIFCDLVQEYHEGDEIVVIGYSRGAFMANTLANLLNCVGIPQPWTEEILKECFELFWTNKLYELEERRKCKEQCHSLEAPIQFLGCLDTVGSLGVPNTGILTPLKCIPRFIRHLQFRSTDLSDNVHVFRQYLALDEYRAIFEPTLMHIDIEAPQNIIQEWFAGSHSDMGRVFPDGTGLGNIVLRRMIEHLSSVNVRFDESQLEKHFRKYSGGRTNLSIENAQEWIHAWPRNTWTVFWSGGGLKKRVPGWYGRKGKKTNEVIHPSVYYRELAKHGNPRKYPSLPGHTRCSNPDGSYVWKKGGSWSSTGSWSSNSSRASRGLDMSVVPEGTPGVLEGLLGGYSLPELL